MRYFLYLLVGLLLVMNGAAVAQPCNATPSVLLTYITQYECITVCEGSATTVQVHRTEGTFTPCDVILSTLVMVYPEQTCATCGDEPYGYATLDPLAWTLDDGNTTFTNTIHGVARGCVRVTWDAILSPGPIVHIDPANGYPQSMCVFVQYAPFATPCFGPFAPGDVPVIVEHPGCNASNPCNTDNFNDPPDTYTSSVHFYSGVGIYLWSATEWGDFGGHLCVTMDHILPVEMVSFTATPHDGAVDLNWRTASERDLTSFRVTHSSNNESEITLGNVPATNHSSGANYQFTDRHVNNGETYTYHLYVTDLNGSETAIAMTAEAMPIADVITSYALAPNYPNPFNPSTTIAYAVKAAGHVMLTVYDLTGRVARELVNREETAGNYTVSFDGTNLPSGIYYYRLAVNGFSATQKMVLLK